MPDECGKDGYPFAWHETIKHMVRSDAGNRCIRCGHPYTAGNHPMERVEDETGRVTLESWSPCDMHCTHKGPVRYIDIHRGDEAWKRVDLDAVDQVAGAIKPLGGNYLQPTHFIVEALARILTVHHLNGVKADCRWWNLASLCQRCHLRVQRVVVLPRVWPWEHSEWFKPYAAGWYAHAYLGEDLTREQVAERLDELLALEQVA